MTISCTRVQEKKKSEEMNTVENPEHAVIVHFNYGLANIDTLHKLEKKLERVIAENKVGEYDGHEIAIDLSDGILYMYGPDAEALFKTVKPTLAASSFMKGAKANLRFGPPEDGTREIEVLIDQPAHFPPTRPSGRAVPHVPRLPGRQVGLCHASRSYPAGR